MLTDCNYTYGSSKVGKSLNPIIGQDSLVCLHSVRCSIPVDGRKRRCFWFLPIGKHGQFSGPEMDMLYTHVWAFLGTQDAQLLLTLLLENGFHESGYLVRRIGICGNCGGVGIGWCRCGRG
jgi:hypothetical protein